MPLNSIAYHVADTTCPLFGTIRTDTIGAVSYSEFDSAEASASRTSSRRSLLFA